MYFLPIEQGLYVKFLVEYINIIMLVDVENLYTRKSSHDSPCMAQTFCYKFTYAYFSE